jgi:hypothetical protein
VHVAGPIPHLVHPVITTKMKPHARAPIAAGTVTASIQHSEIAGIIPTWKDFMQPTTYLSGLALQELFESGQIGFSSV